MVYLAISRKGVDRFLGIRPSPGALWIGAGVLLQSEIDELRDAGIDLTVFNYTVQTSSEVADALPTIIEHHPDQAVFVEDGPTSSFLVRAKGC